MGIQRFYIDQTGKYGEVTIKYMKQTDRETGKNLSILHIFHKGYMIMDADFSKPHIRMFINDDSEQEKIEVLNEALRQMNIFRSLIILRRVDKWMVIIEGRFTPFVSGMEIAICRGEFFASYPFVRKKKSV